MKELKERRQETGMSQFDFVVASGLKGTGNLSAMEQYKKAMTMDAARKYAKTLGMDWGELLLEQSVIYAQKLLERGETDALYDYVSYLLKIGKSGKLPAGISEDFIFEAKKILDTLTETDLSQDK